MQENRNSKGRRSVSAKVDKSERKSPINAQNSKARSNCKKMGRTYTESYEIQRISTKQNNNRGKMHTSFVDNGYNRGLPDKATKQAEQLFEQNFHLKSEVNTLSNKLYLQKSKTQAQKKRHFLYSKKLNRQFEKQMYWSTNKNNDYLITGIKHQYEKMKHMYEEKCEECIYIQKTLSATQLQEVMTYCEALQTENKILIENLSYLKKERNKKASPNHEHHSKSNEGKSLDLIEALLLEERRRIERYKHTNKKLEDSLKEKVISERELEKKITFIEALIIEKENNFYHANKKTKNLQKDRGKLNFELKMLEDKLNINQIKFQTELQNANDINEKKAQIQKMIFDKNLKEKNIHIEKLEKQVGYLSTLLSYWKPLDNMPEGMEKIQQEAEGSYRQGSNSAKNDSGSLRGRNVGRAKTPINHTIDEENQYEDQSVYNNNVSDSLNQEEFPSNPQRVQSIKQLPQKDSVLLEEEPARSPRRSDKRWNENSAKCRKINLTEVQPIGNLLKFKMIAKIFSVEEVKDSLSCKKQSASRFEKDFVSMAEIQCLLQDDPYCLKANEAFNLSRYIVEDQSSEYVYCDEGNEIERAIAKSIIKAAIGDYELPDYNKSLEQWKEIKKTYSHNMQLALRSICPKGVISKDKFLELLNSLGIEMEELTQNWLVGELIKGQSSLETLHYDVIFDKEEKID